MPHPPRPRRLIPFLLLLLSACASAGGSRPPERPPAVYRIGPEDVVEVVVWGNENVSRTVPVRPDGMISLPLINDVRAEGLTSVELRDRLTEAFRKFIPSPELSVIVQQINSPKVLVTGEVVHPGRYVIKGPTTVLDIVMEAGGLTEFASGSDAMLIRTIGSKTATFSVNALADEKIDTRRAVLVEPGDIVVVP
jgi:polysaccharide export outer membrane protein